MLTTVVSADAAPSAAFQVPVAYARGTSLPCRPEDAQPDQVWDCPGCGERVRLQHSRLNRAYFAHAPGRGNQVCSRALCDQADDVAQLVHLLEAHFAGTAPLSLRVTCRAAECALPVGWVTLPTAATLTGLRPRPGRPGTWVVLAGDGLGDGLAITITAREAPLPPPPRPRWIVLDRASFRRVVDHRGERVVDVLASSEPPASDPRCAACRGLDRELVPFAAQAAPMAPEAFLRFRSARERLADLVSRVKEPSPLLLEAHACSACRRPLRVTIQAQHLTDVRSPGRLGDVEWALVVKRQGKDVLGLAFVTAKAFRGHPICKPPHSDFRWGLLDLEAFQRQGRLRLIAHCLKTETFSCPTCEEVAAAKARQEAAAAERERALAQLSQEERERHRRRELAAAAAQRAKERQKLQEAARRRRLRDQQRPLVFRLARFLRGVAGDELVAQRHPRRRRRAQEDAMMMWSSLNRGTGDLISFRWWHYLNRPDDLHSPSGRVEDRESIVQLWFRMAEEPLMMLELLEEQCEDLPEGLRYTLTERRNVLTLPAQTVDGVRQWYILHGIPSGVRNLHP